MEKRFKVVFERVAENRQFFKDDVCKEYQSKIMRLLKDFDEKKAFEILLDNFLWVVNQNFMTTSELLEWFSEEELNAHGIYSKGTHKVAGGRHIGIKNAKLISGLHTEIILFDEAQAECYDTTFLTCFNNAKAEITDGIAWGVGNSEIVANGSRVELFDKATAINKGNSLIIRG